MVCSLKLTLPSSPRLNKAARRSASLRAPIEHSRAALFNRGEDGNAPSDVLAYFSLEHILLEGHCFDEVSGSPPRGLQFVLGTAVNPSQFDTIVMANLGYFQLKANPGAWVLQLREGKSKEIYELSGHSNTEQSKNDSIRVLIDSFSGRTIRVRVSKQKGMEQRSLLSNDNEEEGGIWNTISNT
ncbi:hypothetical protein Y032_1055g3502 [Ancylostoma ceylanicum]|uniref:Uncharacterized protein n=1 Tax=Ancylostoma ceylanicum TaxID=53326 RepID=A0A016W805_9BILA|nr:hypothetical protein Y032_1055g3502 [Ancylostoma ceylanicum]